MFSKAFLLSLSLLLSIPLLYSFLAPRILPPKHLQISLPDELDDLALFRRATLASLHHLRPPSAAIRLGTTNPKPKIAFLFLTNSPLTFAPLWEKFFAGNQNLYNIYIHSDPSSSKSVSRSTGGVFQNRFIAGKKTERASPTLISAARRLLANALLDDPLNSYFALISQHCIPLHSFRYTYKSLFPPRPRFSFPFSSTFYAPNRFQSHIEILSDEPTLEDRYIARGQNVMLPEVPFEEFRVGSQFFVLTRKHALVVIKERRLWRKFRLPCLNLDSCYPEEHYFPTLLSMEDPDGCSHHTLTRVNWTGSTGGHPHTYQSPEVSPKLIYTLRESNSTWSYLFARKFSQDCLKPLMDLADTVILKD